MQIELIYNSRIALPKCQSEELVYLCFQGYVTLSDISYSR